MDALTVHPSAAVTMRPARVEDIPELLAIENAVFTTDRLSSRSLRRLIGAPTAAFIIAEAGGGVAGYALILFQARSLITRLYSIAVAPALVRQGIGTALLSAAEEAARTRGCTAMRLEVQDTNGAAATLYEAAGYRLLGRHARYYEDGGGALRFHKRLAPSHAQNNTPPYFHQTTNFTCGPACVMMAMAWAGRPVQPDAALEFRLWREATTIFMSQGHGGCDPFGMAVTLKRHGLAPAVFVNHPGPYFLHGVRSEEKARVMRVGQDDFRHQADELGIPVNLIPLAESALMETLRSGASAIVLVTGYRMLRRSVPHWVFAYGCTDSAILVHDPVPLHDGAEPEVSAQGTAIPLAAFSRISRFGPENLRAAIVIRKGLPQ
jgi:ribosomal protein S18 acetylase RimI-like enzyme